MQLFPFVPAPVPELIYETFSFGARARARMSLLSLMSLWSFLIRARLGPRP